MCKVLSVSKSGYYNWCNRKPSERESKRKEIAAIAKEFYEESEGVYGYRKVLEDIEEHNPELVCAPETLRLIMASEHLFSCVKRKHKCPPPEKDTQYQYADNVIARDFTASAPNQKWVADITYIRTLEGWLYLACVMDLFSRRIVGWAMSDTIDAELACEALSNAVKSRKPKHEVVHHSDRGCQYASEKFQEVLDTHGIECSMSRSGNPWDNACIESFFGKLKSEWVRGKVYRSREEAKQHLFKYIEMFYNRKRRHASLGYVCPDKFEEMSNKEAA